MVYAAAAAAIQRDVPDYEPRLGTPSRWRWWTRREGLLVLVAATRDAVALALLLREHPPPRVATRDAVALALRWIRWRDIDAVARTLLLDYEPRLGTSSRWR